MFEAPEVGAGLRTVMASEPAVVAGTDAVSWVELTNVVVTPAPLYWTAAPFTNPVPFTVSVWFALDTVAGFGETEVSVGGSLRTWHANTG